MERNIHHYGGGEKIIPALEAKKNYSKMEMRVKHRRKMFVLRQEGFEDRAGNAVL